MQFIKHMLMDLSFGSHEIDMKQVTMLLQLLTKPHEAKKWALQTVQVDQLRSLESFSEPAEAIAASHTLNENEDRFLDALKSMMA